MALERAHTEPSATCLHSDGHGHCLLSNEIAKQEALGSVYTATPCCRNLTKVQCKGQKTSHKLEGNVGRERAVWLETFQRRAGGWSATPGNCDGKIIRVLSTGRSCSDLHSADEKMSIEGDVKGENPREHNCQTWTEL